MVDNLTTTVDTKGTNSAENQGKTINIIVEKLDGGYIANPNGKRRIFKDADDIIDVIGFNNVLDGMENEEYHLDIRFIPKDKYIDFDSLVALHNASDEITLEGAKESGLIEKQAFNPLPTPVEPDLTAPIKVTIANAYTADRLKKIDWVKYHDELPLQPSEITKITGMNTTTLYASLAKVRKGVFSFQHSGSRVGFTILAQYYERTLGIRATTKDQCEKMKEDLLKMIRTLEVYGVGKSFIKTSEVQNSLLEMRKVLLG